MYTVEFGRERVDLSYLEQLAEAGQTEAIARMIGEFAGSGGSPVLRELVEGSLAAVEESGLDALGSFRGHPGAMSLPRPQELAATVNRIRSLRAVAG